MSFELRHPDSITIGQRHGRQVGALKELAESIDQVGLLHPIVVTSECELVAGERRLRAWQLAKPGEPIPVHVVDLPSIAKGELAENLMRAPLLPSEIDAIRRNLEADEKEKARERQSLLNRPDAGGKFPQADKGRTRDKIGAFAGVSGRTIDKIAAVVAAGEAEPERFGKLVDDMDRTGKVDRSFKLRTSRAHARPIKRKEQGGSATDPESLAAAGFSCGSHPCRSALAVRDLRGLR